MKHRLALRPPARAILAPTALSPHKAIALAADPSRILVAQGIAPDPWQRAFLLCPARQALLNCSRQAERWRETQRGVFGMDIWDDDSLWTGL